MICLLGRREPQTRPRPRQNQQGSWFMRKGSSVASTTMLLNDVADTTVLRIE